MTKGDSGEIENGELRIKQMANDLSNECFLPFSFSQFIFLDSLTGSVFAFYEFSVQCPHE